jgi:putative membrane protein
MNKIANILIAAIALLHFVIAYVEMFAWTTIGPKMFASFPAELFEPTQSMAANQGIYNAFLAVGLVWALVIKDQAWSRNVATCFLLFVAAAGLFGALTVSITILFVQTVPSVIALVFLHLGKAKPVVSN